MNHSLAIITEQLVMKLIIHKRYRLPNNKAFKNMVRGAGLEPARPFGHDILSVDRLPVTTPAQDILSYFYHDVLVEGYGNSGKVSVNFLIDYHVYCHLCGQVRLVFCLRQLALPIRTVHTLAV
jgi:hypothetical protein